MDLPTNVVGKIAFAIELELWGIKLRRGVYALVDLRSLLQVLALPIIL
jgi:hypothetical protein